MPRALHDGLHFKLKKNANTDRAGASGNEQWGLDAGHHQGALNPYINMPKFSSWDGRSEKG